MVSPLEVTATMATMATVGLFGIWRLIMGNYPDVAIVAVLPFLLRVVSTCLGHDHRRSWTRHDVYPMEEGQSTSVRPTPGAPSHGPTMAPFTRWLVARPARPTVSYGRYRPMGWHQEAPTRRPGCPTRRPGATFRPTRCPGASRWSLTTCPGGAQIREQNRVVVDGWCTTQL